MFISINIFSQSKFKFFFVIFTLLVNYPLFFRIKSFIAKRTDLCVKIFSSLYRVILIKFYKIQKKLITKYKVVFKDEEMIRNI